jgi:hypothetical protein
VQRNWKAIVAAFLASSLVTLAGVLLFFQPIQRSDAVHGPLTHPALGLAVYAALSIALFDRVARRLGARYEAAFVIGASQWVLVNLDFVLRGERGLMTAAAGTLLMAVTWSAAAFAYSRFQRRPPD